MDNILTAPKKFCQGFVESYPGHQVSPMIEEFASEYFKKHELVGDWIFLDVWWTSFHANSRLLPKWRKKWLGEKKRRYNNLGQWLRRVIDPDKRYFTICQDAQGVEFDQLIRLPDNVLVFSAGGVGNVPVPLLCDLYDKDFVCVDEREVLVSFRGVIKHPVHRYPWRECILDEFSNKPDCVIEDTVDPGTEVTRPAQRYADLMKGSVFSLCPRGYGKTSFRLYEALRYGSIPIYIHDGEPWLPYQDEIDWEALAIITHYRDVPGLFKRLTAISPEQISQMQEYGNTLLARYFSMQGTMDYIVRTLGNR